MRNVSDKMYRKNQNTVLCSITPFSETLVAYEIMWTNMVEPDRPQMTIWRMRISFGYVRHKNTHTEYVILVAFPLQQWSHERALVLRYTCISCLVITQL